MSLRTSAKQSVELSVPGSQYAFPGSPSAKACWVLKKRHTRFSSAIISFVLRWARRLSQASNPATPGFRPAKKTVKVPWRQHMIYHFAECVNFAAQTLDVRRKMRHGPFNIDDVEPIT